ncbi:hypothetical protein ACFFP0_14020 [Rhizobium puerariae]|uniref:Uncharacterized protein n=1 Tax=Rhizobium puerariae TaxID=1585791 RepID=A0ABV6AHE7_9HYPH
MAVTKIALASQWKSVTDILDCLRRAREFREQQIKLLDSLEKRVDLRRTEFTQSLADLPAAARLQLVTRVTNGLRADLKRQTADTRRAYIQSINQISAEVEPVKPHYQSAMQLLMRDNIGSERRSRLTYQTESSGPAELASLAALSASTKDRELGAAVCVRAFAMAADQRRFSPQELADHLTGEDYRKVNQAFLEIERLAIEAVHADTAFERGQSNPGRSVRLALRKRSETAIGADLDNLEGQIEQATKGQPEAFR